MNRGSERTEVKNGSIASVRPSRHPAAYARSSSSSARWPLTLERVHSRILHEHGGPVRAVGKSPAVGREDLVEDLSRAGGCPATVKMIGVGELHRVGRGVEETVGRALEQRGDMVGCIRRTGKRLDLRAREQDLDVVRRLLRRGADSVGRRLRPSPTQVQQRQQNLQAAVAGRAGRRCREKALRSRVVVKLHERNTLVIASAPGVGIELTCPQCVLERLVVPPGGHQAMGEIHQASAVAGIEGDGLEIGGQRFAQPAHLVQVQGEAAIAGRQLRVDLERTVRGLDAASEGRAVAVRAQKVIGVGDFTVGCRKLRVDRDGTVSADRFWPAGGLPVVLPGAVRARTNSSYAATDDVGRLPMRACSSSVTLALSALPTCTAMSLCAAKTSTPSRSYCSDQITLSRLRVDELDVDSHASALLANGAGDRAADAELLGERGQLTAWILELGYRGTADHAQRTEL